MELSIITVNLNNAAGLERTINSVLSQTHFADIEYIIIDGSSVDGSQEVIRGRGNRIDHWLSEPDSGVYDAMNKGVRAASGKYVLFLNSGDVLSDDAVIGKTLGYLGSAAIVYGDILFDFGQYQQRYSYPDQLTFRFFCEKSLGHPSTFIRRELFATYGMYDLDYPIVADWVFFCRVICKHNVAVQHLPIVVAIFDMSGMSNDPANAPQVTAERTRLLSTEFSLFHRDYLAAKQTERCLERIKSSKAYRWLGALGVKKFKQ